MCVCVCERERERERPTAGHGGKTTKQKLLLLSRVTNGPDWKTPALVGETRATAT